MYVGQSDVVGVAVGTVLVDVLDDVGWLLAIYVEDVFVLESRSW